jgi:hypothetical protein
LANAQPPQLQGVMGLIRMHGHNQLRDACPHGLSAGSDPTVMQGAGEKVSRRRPYLAIDHHLDKLLARAELHDFEARSLRQHSKMTVNDASDAMSPCRQGPALGQ